MEIGEAGGKNTKQREEVKEKNGKGGRVNEESIVREKNKSVLLFYRYRFHGKVNIEPQPD